MTTSLQQSLISLGLKLKDIFILGALKRLSSPTTVDNILKFNPLIELNNKNLRLVINKLEQINMLVKFRTHKGLFFLFPFLKPTTKNRKYRLLKVQNKPFSCFENGQLKPIPFYIYNYINKVYIKHNEHKETIDDVFYVKQSLIVNKSNYSLIYRLKTRFKKDFPTKNNYLNTPLPIGFNYKLFSSKIKASPFLSSKDNLGLTWLIKNYDAIINDQYAPFYLPTTEQNKTSTYKNGFSERTYTSNELASLYDNLTDIEL